jgi:FkbM family methyltransferase
VIPHRSQIETAVQTLLAPELSALAKLHFLWRGRGGDDDYEIDMTAGHVFLSAGNDKTDRSVFREIFLRGCYHTDYQGAVAVDVGAHKGYFGAYALIHGAEAVHSYEPESDNFRFLELTAETFRLRGRRWTTYRAAIAAEAGRVDLVVDPESWAHSLASVVDDRNSAMVQKVSAVTLETVIAESRGRAPVVVKIDAEGAECFVLGTNPDSWDHVREIFLEVHDFARCSRHQIVCFLRDAGFSLRTDKLNVLHFQRLDRACS